MNRRLRTTVLIVAAALPAAAGAYFAFSPRLDLLRQRAITQQLLDSGDPDQRARGAWRVLDHPDAALVPTLVQRVMGDEADPQAREACVYTLGKLGEEQSGRVAARRSTPFPESAGWDAALPALLYAIDLDESGVVRAAAWLALARVSETRFRERVASRKRETDAPWEQIGIAEGLLAVGDATRVRCLLRWAVEGDEEQRYVASQASYKFLRPLLESAGRWPLEPPVAQAQPWPAEFVAQMSRRCESLDLTSIAREAQAQFADHERLRSTLRRITNAREWIARWLYSE